MKLTENFQEVISNLVPYQKYTDIQDAAFSLVFFKTPEIVKQRPQRSSFLQKQALTTSLQNNCSKQQQTISGKLTSVFEKDFTIAVLLHKKLQKAKIKASKGKKISNADANADVNTDVDAALPMPRFPNGPFVFMLK